MFINQTLIHQYEFVNACDKGDLEIVKVLIIRGEYITDVGLQSACVHGHLNIVKYLVQEGADANSDGGYPLIYACEHGHLDIVKYLVENGANVYEECSLALSSAIESDHLEIVKYFVEQGFDFERKNSYVDEEENLVVEESTILEDCCKGGHIRIAIYLLKYTTKHIQFMNNSHFCSFYTLITTFYNNEQWTKIPNVKQDYLFEPNVSLIVASFVW